MKNPETDQTMYDETVDKYADMMYGYSPQHELACTYDRLSDRNAYSTRGFHLYLE